jgi:hypothetical protein
MSDQLSGWLDDEIGKQAFGEDFRYDTGWQVIGTKQGAMVVHNVAVTMRHPVIGHNPFTAVFKVPAPMMSEEPVREGMRQTIAGLRERHRAYLGQLKNAGAPPVTQGPSPFS